MLIIMKIEEALEYILKNMEPKKGFFEVLLLSNTTKYKVTVSSLQLFEATTLAHHLVLTQS
jgi:hypothetical protein